MGMLYVKTSRTFNYKSFLSLNGDAFPIENISDYLPVHNDVNDFTLEWNKYVGYYSLTYNNCKYRLLDFQAVLETLE